MDTLRAVVIPTIIGLGEEFKETEKKVQRIHKYVDSTAIALGLIVGTACSITDCNLYDNSRIGAQISSVRKQMEKIHKELYQVEMYIASVQRLTEHLNMLASPTKMDVEDIVGYSRFSELSADEAKFLLDALELAKEYINSQEVDDIQDLSDSFPRSTLVLEELQKELKERIEMGGEVIVR